MSQPVPATELVAPLPHTTRGRWQILQQQLRAGQEPCFSSDKRHFCADVQCRWRSACLALRAQWRR